jgi:hypothetical protein
MNKHSTAQQWKWLLFAIVLVCSIYVPMSSKTAKAEGVARVGYTSGFNDQFTTSASNWGILSGKWTYGSGILRGNGVKNGYTNIFFSKAQYANFDYQVRMRRTGCPNCANTIYVRANGSKNVYFTYANTGSYTIGACTASSCTIWEDWTATTSIVQGGYNTLRIVAVGNLYKFYINNQLESFGTASGWTGGYVGIKFFSWVTAGNTLDVDWAILNKK